MTKLINSSDKEIRATKVLLPNENELKRPINLLYPLETAMRLNDTDVERVNRKKNDSEEIDINHMIARPKRQTNEIARSKLKDYYADEIGTLAWFWECRESRET